jgi:predicted DNA-binding transcriptional regulator AlpA
MMQDDVDAATYRLDVHAKHARHLNQIELARRWSLSPRTLERWRWLKQGPRYIKLGSRVVYCRSDIEAFEASQARTATASPMPPVTNTVRTGR